MQKELGEEALCLTCASFPRHTEEYPGLRELSLSLACPEAARLILFSPVSVLSEEERQGEPDELDYGEFDEAFFAALIRERERLFSILTQREVPIELRMKKLCLEAERWQKRYGESYGREQNEDPEPDAVPGGKAEEWETSFPTDLVENESTPAVELPSERLKRMRKELEILMELEVIDYGWTDRMEETGRFLWEHDEQEYSSIREEFLLSFRAESADEADLYETHNPASGEPELTLALIKERVSAYFLYVYLPGAVYDGEMASKVRFTVFFADWLEELLMIRWWNEGKKLTIRQIIRTAGRLSRQIEHSDENLDSLEREL